MRRHAPTINNSSRRQGLFKHPLLLLGLLVLVFALYRVFVMHGDLHELHESLKQQAQNQRAADAYGAPADVQVSKATSRCSAAENTFATAAICRSPRCILHCM
jgi:hypothetical protein